MDKHYDEVNNEPRAVKGFLLTHFLICAKLD
jgi:hypothetical protein